MNLRGIANAGIQVVNPNITVTVKRSNGFTTGAGAKQVPLYTNVPDIQAQLQALSADDVQQISGLNIQGTVRSIYLYGYVAGVVRPDQKGGDLVLITDTPGLPGERTWLVVKVLEAWPEWSKAVIVLQGE